jgi:hypothetical protein
MQYSTALPSSVELLLSTAEIVKNGDVWELTGMPQVSRTVYESFKKVLEALGGSWNGKTHLFYRDPTAAIQEVLQVGKMPALNPYSLFETPDPIVTELLDYIGIHHETDPTFQWRILEPSAGKGAIARQIRDRLPHAQIDCLEIDPINREILEAQGFNVIGEDFLSAELEGGYHFIAMNPPFNGREYIKHIQKAKGLLGLNGMLGVIAPQGMMTDSTKAGIAFRNQVAELGECESIGSPFEFTKTACVLLKMRNLPPDELERQWSRINGYPSWPAYELMLHLDNEPAWHELQSKNVRDRQTIGDLADSLVNQFLREGMLLYYTEALKEYAINAFIDDLQEDEPEVELQTHFKKMNSLATKAQPAKKRHKHVQVPLFDQAYVDGVEQLELAV